MTTPYTIQVDVIIPVHNAGSTIRETVQSAMSQEYIEREDSFNISLSVCCYDDGSTDDSLEILREFQKEYEEKLIDNLLHIPSRLLIESGSPARGAGYARNRAVAMNNQSSKGHSSTTRFLCLLDSDDTMHKHRVSLQAKEMMQLPEETRNKTLLGCTFERIPADSTWHYSQWANGLTDERLMLERFREVTLLQPTWFMPRKVFETVGGYVEAPLKEEGDTDTVVAAMAKSRSNGMPPLIHPRFDTPESLKLAEDLRYFHAHLQNGGTLRLLRHGEPLMQYRYDGGSQSFRTSRKLLLQLRVLAFEQSILSKDWQGKKFIIWGAGRDGKDFFKALEPEHQERVYCFVDVDAKKLAAGYYVQRKEGSDKKAALKIPIVHFSFLIADDQTRKDLQEKWENDLTSNDKTQHGNIDKSKPESSPASTPAAKRQKTGPKAVSSVLQDRGLDHELLHTLPVVVCVAMYRTSGVLERNVASIQRIEGSTLWHFS